MSTQTYQNIHLPYILQDEFFSCSLSSPVETGVEVSSPPTKKTRGAGRKGVKQPATKQKQRKATKQPSSKQRVAKEPAINQAATTGTEEDEIDDGGDGCAELEGRERFSYAETLALVTFRLEMQPRFDMPTAHSEHWNVIRKRMIGAGHPPRTWQNLRQKYAKICGLYAKEFAARKRQSGFGDGLDLEAAETVVFEDQIMVLLHKHLHHRPKMTCHTRIQSSGGAKGPTCAEEEEGSTPGYGGRRSRRPTKVNLGFVFGVLIFILYCKQAVEVEDATAPLITLAQLNGERVSALCTALASKYGAEVSSHVTPIAGPVTGMSVGEAQRDPRLVEWLASFNRQSYAIYFERKHVDFQALQVLEQGDFQGDEQTNLLKLSVVIAREVWNELVKLKNAAT